MLEKVMIIGCPGAGKSTFERKLSKKTICLYIIWICCGIKVIKLQLKGKHLNKN